MHRFRVFNVDIFLCGIYTQGLMQIHFYHWIIPLKLLCPLMDI